MPKFLTQYDDDRAEREKVTFSETIPDYDLKVQPDGSKVLVKSDRTINIFERIQQAKEGTDFKELVKRYRMSGDISILNQTLGGKYLDVSLATGSLVKMQAVLDNARILFENSPLEVRQKYNSDLGQFLSAVDSGQFQKDFAPEPEPEPEPKKE